MHVEYPTTYTDKFGQEKTRIYNDGKNLSMQLRGIDFRGASFDDFVTNMESVDLLKILFPLHPAGGYLCSCRIECAIPIIVTNHEQVEHTNLHMRLDLGDPDHRNAIDKEELFLSLSYQDQFFTSYSGRGWFEDALNEIQEQLPPGLRMKTCFTCYWSDYHPVGNGIFGSMACFRLNKTKYIQMGHDKHALMRLWEERDEFVQETYYCSEHQQRPPNTGYRG